MTSRGVLVIGSGKRVRKTALPAFAQAAELFSIRHVVARTAKTIDVGGTSIEVASMDALTADHLRDVDLVYMAVAKKAVPAVLAKLAEFDTAQIDMLIDTPVVRFRHMHHAEQLRGFRNAWVAEDCSVLPWFETVHAAVDAGQIGRLERVVFFQSAYAYHAVATAKTLLRNHRVKRGNRQSLGREFGTRRMQFAQGQEAVVFEPRDYPSGRLLLLGSSGSITDYPYERDGNLVLETVADKDDCAGFRIGDVETQLSPGERALAGGARPGVSVTARMDDMKRVGFLKLLTNIASGAGAYPVSEALDDISIDYHLEKLGRYFSNPVSSPRYASGRFLLGLGSRIGG